MQNSFRNVSLKVVYTTDVHGCFQPVDFTGHRKSRGGLSCVHAYLCRVRGRCPRRVILLDGGDMLQGTPATYYHNYVSTKRPHLAARMMNRLGYDAACVGNHDLETGHEVYDRWAADCHFPVLGANLVDESTGKPYFEPYTVVEREGVRVAVLGLVTEALPYWLPRFLWKGIRVERMVESARRWVDHIRRVEHPHVIIGVFHSGMEGGLSVPGYEENVTRALLEQVGGFDAVCCGHDHLRHQTTVEDAEGKSVPVVSPSACAWNVGELTVDVSLDDEGRVVDKRVEGRLVDVTSFWNRKAKAFEEEFRKELDMVARFVEGKVAVSNARIRSRDAYFGPSAFVDLQHVMQLRLTGAYVSLASSVMYDTCLPLGELRVRDMFNLYKFENFLCTLHMSGREILGALEWSYAHWTRQMASPDESVLLLSPSSRRRGRRRFSNMPYHFDSAAGLFYTVDVTKPAGKRVTVECMADGTPFCPDKEYLVVTNSYRATGGGELFTRGSGILLKDLPARIVTISEKDIRHCFIEYLRGEGRVSPHSLNLWCFVPSEWTDRALDRDSVLLFGR